MKATFHQPEHLVWLGLIDKISKADLFVIIDTVQYRRHYFQNRNKIRTKNGWQWLIVPLKKHPRNILINEVEISYGYNWTQKYLKSLEVNYGKSKYFALYFPSIKEIIEKRHRFLADLNEELLLKFLAWFSINVKVLKSSDLGLGKINGGGNKVVLEHCKRLNIKQFLSGEFGKDYLDESDFKKEGIELIFHHFNHPTYQQLFKPFIPGMSAIDLLFNYGPDSKKVLWRD